MKTEKPTMTEANTFDAAGGIARTLRIPREDAAFYLAEGGTYPPNWPDIADLMEDGYGPRARAEAAAEAATEAKD